MLKCISYFRQGLWEFGEGDLVEQHPAIESWLLDSYPAHFEKADAPAEVVTADVVEPPADKAIKRARGRK